MSKKFITAIVVLAAITSMGCAQRSSNIVPANVSSFQYANQDCLRLQSELSTKQSRLAQLSKKQDNMATTDAVAMTVGMLVFWPALAVNLMTPDHKAEIAQLKGEVTALTNAVEFECGNDSQKDFDRNYAGGN